MHAVRLLCTLTVRPHDLQLPRNYLLQFYRALHHNLISDDQEMINVLIKYCGARFFSLQLPGYSLLMLDFLHAANTIISSAELKGVRLHSLACFVWLSQEDIVAILIVVLTFLE